MTGKAGSNVTQRESCRARGERRETITWTGAGRAKGQARGLQTIDSFHTHGARPWHDGRIVTIGRQATAEEARHPLDPLTAGEIRQAVQSCAGTAAPASGGGSPASSWPSRTSPACSRGSQVTR